MANFTCKTKIHAGAGSLAVLKELGIRRLFVVTDPFFLKNGTAARIADLAGAEEHTLYGDVQPDPDVAVVARAAAAMKQFRADGVLAIGGGSAMDCAKAAVYFAGGGVQLIAVPTTSGSGSEVTDFAVITVGKVKYPLVDGALQPDVAILDSDLLMALPKGLIADSGYDALAHGVEAYVAAGHSPMSDALAAGAVSAILSRLPGSYAGATEQRMAVHSASTMAAMAFSQAGLGVCHALSHSLGGLFHVPHGRLNAVLLPAVVDCNAKTAPARYVALSRGAGIEGSSDFMAVKNLKAALLRLRRQLSLPETLPEAGISGAQLRRELPAVLRAAQADACAQTNPVPVTEALLRQILGEVAAL